jgi:hypothetical protein
MGVSFHCVLQAVGLSSAVLLGGCSPQEGDLSDLSPMFDSGHEDAGDGAIPLDAGQLDASPPAQACDTIDEVFPPQACSGLGSEFAIQSIEVETLPLRILGSWYRCSPGELFLGEEGPAGIEFLEGGEWYALESPVQGSRPVRPIGAAPSGTWRFNPDGSFSMFSTNSDSGFGTLNVLVSCAPQQLVIAGQRFARGPAVNSPETIGNVGDFPDEDCVPGESREPDFDEEVLLERLVGIWRLCAGDIGDFWLDGPGDLFGIGIRADGTWRRVLRNGDDLVWGGHLADLGDFWIYDSDFGESIPWHIAFGPPVDEGFPYVNGVLQLSLEPRQWQVQSFDGQLLLFAGPN